MLQLGVAASVQADPRKSQQAIEPGTQGSSPSLIQEKSCREIKPRSFNQLNAQIPAGTRRISFDDSPVISEQKTVLQGNVTLKKGIFHYLPKLSNYPTSPSK